MELLQEQCKYREKWGIYRPTEKQDGDTDSEQSALFQRTIQCVAIDQAHWFPVGYNDHSAVSQAYYCVLCADM